MKIKWLILIFAGTCSSVFSADSTPTFLDIYPYIYDQGDKFTALSVESSSLEGCEGQKKAGELRVALDTLVPIRELCYELDKAGNVKLTDPTKWVFKSFTLSASLFVNKKAELKQAAEQERLRKAAAFVEQSNRFIEELNKPSPQLPSPLPPAGIICIPLGTDMMHCR